jgi:hypothetical protein
MVTDESRTAAGSTRDVIFAPHREGRFVFTPRICAPSVNDHLFRFRQSIRERHRTDWRSC